MNKIKWWCCTFFALYRFVHLYKSFFHQNSSSHHSLQMKMACSFNFAHKFIANNKLGETYSTGYSTCIFTQLTTGALWFSFKIIKNMSFCPSFLFFSFPHSPPSPCLVFPRNLFLLFTLELNLKYHSFFLQLLNNNFVRWRLQKWNSLPPIKFDQQQCI